jgi:hypothetical protein
MVAINFPNIGNKKRPAGAGRCQKGVSADVIFSLQTPPWASKIVEKKFSCLCKLLYSPPEKWAFL